jgi:glycosyltransferase involved in cell wall biosynthesis
MRNDLPKISIITPSFKQAAFVEETIKSVLDQGYPNLEYLVVDGGSKDGTIDILKKYEKQLSWISEKDRGQSDALNKGFRRATGDVLAFINSDDRYEPGALKAVGEYYASHPEAMWVTGKCRVIDAGSREIRKNVTAYKNFWLWWGSYNALLVLDYVSQPSTFWHRKVVEKVGLFDESLHYSMDYDYSLRVGQHFKLNFLNAYLASFRIHGASKSDSIRSHFGADLGIASRYAKSPLLRWLHKMHNNLIIFMYERWQNSSRA